MVSKKASAGAALYKAYVFIGTILILAGSYSLSVCVGLVR